MLLASSPQDYDGAEPAASSIALANLWRLGGLCGGEEGQRWRERVAACAGAFGERLSEAPIALPQMACALHLLTLGHPRQVVLAGRIGSPEMEALVDAAHAPFAPGACVVLLLLLALPLRCLPPRRCSCRRCCQRRHSSARTSAERPSSRLPTLLPAAACAADKVVIQLDPSDAALMDFWQAHNPEAVAVAGVAQRKGGDGATAFVCQVCRLGCAALSQACRCAWQRGDALADDHRPLPLSPLSPLSLFAAEFRLQGAHHFARQGGRAAARAALGGRSQAAADGAAEAEQAVVSRRGQPSPAGAPLRRSLGLYM